MKPFLLQTAGVFVPNGFRKKSRELQKPMELSNGEWLQKAFVQPLAQGTKVWILSPLAALGWLILESISSLRLRKSDIQVGEGRWKGIKGKIDRSLSTLKSTEARLPAQQLSCSL
jgi:hypothetical protein